MTRLLAEPLFGRDDVPVVLAVVGFGLVLFAGLVLVDRASRLRPWRNSSTGLRRCNHRSHRLGLPCLREWSWQHRCYRHVTCNPCPKETP